MRQAQLSNTITAIYDEEDETYRIKESLPRHTHILWLNRDEISNLLDFACKMMQRKLAFQCNRCPERFDSLRELINHAENNHKVHLKNFHKRLQDQAFTKEG